MHCFEHIPPTAPTRMNRPRRHSKHLTNHVGIITSHAKENGNIPSKGLIFLLIFSSGLTHHHNEQTNFEISHLATFITHRDLQGQGLSAHATLWAPFSWYCNERTRWDVIYRRSNSRRRNSLERLDNSARPRRRHPIISSRFYIGLLVRVRHPSSMRR